MKKGNIILSVIVVVIITLGLVTWNQRNHAFRLENRVKAQYAANQSEYDNMWKKFKEITQVTDLQAEQFKSVYTDLISGRYEDSNLLFKSVQEQNPQLDTSVYTQLQREISAGRNTFNNSQKQILDIVREYNDYVGTRPLMMLLGKATLNENDYIVTSAKTQDAFNSKKDDEIKLR